MNHQYHSLPEIMTNAKLHAGNKEPEPERVSREAEREKLLPPGFKPKKKRLMVATVAVFFEVHERQTSVENAGPILIDAIKRMGGVVDAGYAAYGGNCRAYPVEIPEKLADEFRDALMVSQEVAEVPFDRLSQRPPTFTTVELCAPPQAGTADQCKTPAQ